MPDVLERGARACSGVAAKNASFSRTNRRKKASRRRESPSPRFFLPTFFISVAKVFFFRERDRHGTDRRRIRRAGIPPDDAEVILRASFFFPLLPLSFYLVPPMSSDSTSSGLAAMQQHEADSDDSGVDVKPRMLLIRDSTSPLTPPSTDPRRNKRKSSEPKNRKEVLLMKRFRWDTDEEDAREDEDDVFDVLSRPSSGDSGCQPEEGQLRKAAPRKWRRTSPPAVKIEEDEDCSSPPAFRQSVIRKNESLHSQQGEEEEEDNERSSSKESPDKARTTSRPSSRNYKGMSRQRRIEANARERTRVHTISAAFESLRRAVPAYAHNQKLSKLAVLRIASAYIVALACLNDGGGGGPRATTTEVEVEDESSLPECVEQCTRTIQAEGRSRRRTSKD